MRHCRENAAYDALFLIGVLACFLAFAGPVPARADAGTPAEGAAAQRPDDAEKPLRIQDNSFLLEEAYNQETGVVQHIQIFQYMRDDTWSYAFTQEWPFPNRTHQLSYTIPFLRPDESSNDDGLGDVLLNYRYQAIASEHVAFAPRLSLIFPTGDEKEGLGNDAFGVQTNMPLSIELSERWVTHLNAGATFIPDAKNAGGAKADIFGYNLGAGLVLNAAKNVDLMLESIWTSNESVEAGGSTKRSDAFFISPGIRFAIDHKSGLQIVPGIAVPIGLGPSRDEVGVFFYLSLEHPFKKTAKE